MVITVINRHFEHIKVLPVHLYVHDPWCVGAPAPYLMPHMRYSKLLIKPCTLVKKAFQLPRIVEQSGRIVRKHGTWYIIHKSEALGVVSFKCFRVGFKKMVDLLHWGVKRVVLSYRGSESST